MSTDVMATAGAADQGRVTADVNWGAVPSPDSGWLAHRFGLNALWRDRGVAAATTRNVATGVARL